MIGKRKIVSLCLSTMQDVPCYELITSLNKSLTARGNSLFVYSTSSDMYWNEVEDVGETAVFDLIDYNITDAVIIFDRRIPNKKLVATIIERARDHRIPVVLLDGAGQGCINVNFDYEGDFEQVVRHVVEHHRPKSFHFMAGMRDNEFSDRRIAVFRRVLEEAGYPFDESMVSYGDFWYLPAQRATEELIRQKRVPGAIVCANDVMALSVISTLEQHGFSVPGDVIVTGFDGIDEIRYSTPTVTSCRCGYREMGERTIELLEDYFQGRIPTEGDYFVPSSPILAESCGCGSRKDINISEYLNKTTTRLQRVINDNLHLTQMAARINTSRTAAQIAAAMENHVIYDMCCLVKKECIDETVDPLLRCRRGEGEAKLCLLFDSDAPKPFLPRDFDGDDIAPDLEAILEQNVPLAFMSLCFHEIPFGYVCFHFTKGELDDYCGTSLIVSALNNGIGGFRNLRYQNYLTRQIEEMYKLDPLTGLYNRTGFMKVYQELVEELRDQGGCITVAMADLDGLKAINDGYGHNEGDNAIRTVAQALRQGCPEDAIATRFGGDEMFAVMKGIQDGASIRSRVESFLTAYNTSSGKPYRVSASMGICLATHRDDLDPERLMKEADKQMYQEKSQKKDK